MGKQLIIIAGNSSLQAEFVVFFKKKIHFHRDSMCMCFLLFIHNSCLRARSAGHIRKFLFKHVYLLVRMSKTNRRCSWKSHHTEMNGFIYKQCRFDVERSFDIHSEPDGYTGNRVVIGFYKLRHNVSWLMEFQGKIISLLNIICFSALAALVSIMLGLE